MKKRETYIAIVVVLVIGGLYMSTSGIDSRQHDGNASALSNVTKVSATEVDEVLANEDVFVLDVHIPEQTHIPGTDAFIPYNEIAENVDALPEDKDTPIFVYCRSGSMSDQASQEIAELGYSEVYDLVGGVNAYKESHVDVSVEPVVYDFGEVVYGDIPTTEFTFTNYTPEPLAITRVSTSCTCTTTDLEPVTLDPYSSTIFTVAFNPAIHGDDTDLGELTRTVYVETDNPNFPKVTADITANVRKS